MSTANKFFKTAIAQDVAYRQSQQRPLFHSGTNRVSQGKSSPDNKKIPQKPKLFIAGSSVAGGEDVAG